MSPRSSSSGGRLARLWQGLVGTAGLGPSIRDGIDRYRVLEQLGRGTFAAVYSAVDRTSEDRVVLKIFDRSRVEGERFLRTLTSDNRIVSEIGHRHILPVYDVGQSADGYIYVAMAQAAGGSLRQLLDHQGRLDLGRACEVLEAVAQALHAAHERGVVHHDVKPSNVLLDHHGQPMLADFGSARTSYGLRGTPGYIAPEQVLGGPVDRRRDVFALGVVAFEMLTGSSPHPTSSATEAVLAAVQEPPPVASEVNPELPATIDQALDRALAKVPEERYATTVDLARDLVGRARRPAAAAAGWDSASAADRQRAVRSPAPPSAAREGAVRTAGFEPAVAKLEEILELALSASILVDEKSFVTGWNSLAERTFGWTRDEILGRSLVTTLVPPRYREAHERGLQRYLSTGQGPVLGKKLELSALHKQGWELPIELSISEAVRSGSQARILAFVRDISQEQRQRKLRVAQSAVARLMEETDSLQAAAPRLLEVVGGELGWSAGALWLPGGGPTLRCVEFWPAEPPDGDRFKEASLASEFKKGEGLPGLAWARGEPVWLEDLVAGEDSPRVLSAVRAGLHTAVAVPVLRAGEIRGVVELFASKRWPEDPMLLTGLSNLVRKIGLSLKNERAHPDGQRDAAHARHDGRRT